MAGARVLLTLLSRNHPCTQFVQRAVVETTEPYATIPDCIMIDDANAAQVCGVPGTGVFQVGQPAAKGPVTPLATGVPRRISDLIGGGNPHAAVATNVYWMCCRAIKPDATRRLPNRTLTSVQAGPHNFDEAREKVAAATGYKPSEVVARRGRWR